MSTIGVWEDGWSYEKLFVFHFLIKKNRKKGKKRKLFWELKPLVHDSIEIWNSVWGCSNLKENGGKKKWKTKVSS